MVNWATKETRGPLPSIESWLINRCPKTPNPFQNGESQISEPPGPKPPINSPKTNVSRKKNLVGRLLSFSSWWLNQPNWKKNSQIGSFPQVSRGQNKKSLKNHPLEEYVPFEMVPLKRWHALVQICLKNLGNHRAFTSIGLVAGNFHGSDIIRFSAPGFLEIMVRRVWKCCWNMDPGCWSGEQNLLVNSVVDICVSKITLRFDLLGWKQLWLESIASDFTLRKGQRTMILIFLKLSFILGDGVF